jgi:hypothetical protein
MATTVGRIQSLKVNTTQGMIVVLRETPTGLNIPPVPPGPDAEIFLVWTADVHDGARTIFMPELSRALAHGLRIQIDHDAHSSFVRELVVFGPLEGSLL